jgi:photosystem II stability/assembly factor-like uncharacterized protein
MKVTERIYSYAIHVAVAFSLILGTILHLTEDVVARIPTDNKSSFSFISADDPRAFAAVSQRGNPRPVTFNLLDPTRVTVRDIGPEFGDSFAVAGFIINRDDPRQILLPSVVNISRSFNGGMNWTPADLLSSTGFADGTYYVRQDPANPQVLFAVKEDFSGPAEGGLYRSEDFGGTWTRLDWDLDPIDCAIHEASSDVVLVLSRFAVDDPYEPLWRSEDGGQTFERQLNSGLPKAIYDPDTEEHSAIPYFSNIATTPADPNIVYVVQYFDELGYYPPSIYKSVDGGITFSRLEGGPSYPLQVFPHPTQPNVLFVQTNTPAPNIYRSTDGGTSFEPMTNGLPSNRANYFVAFDAQNPSFVYVAGQGGFFRSANGGDSFQPLGLTTEQLGLGATTASVDPSNSRIIYVNTNRGNFKSFNGGVTFLSINNGWRTAGANHIAFDNDTNPNLYLAVPLGIGLLKTHNRGSNYERVPGPVDPRSVTLLAIARTDPDIIFAGTSNTGLFRTTDGGASWTPSTIDTGLTRFTTFSSEIAIDPNNPNNVYFVSSNFGAGGFFRSTDGGSIFQRTDMNINALQRFTDLAIDPLNTNVIFTGTSSNEDFAPFKSNDFGLTFTNGPIYRASIRDIVIDPTNSNNIYLVGRFQLTYQGLENRAIVRSTDGGATYSAADNGLPDNAAIIGIVIDPENPARLYAWTNRGLFMTNDRGTTWTLLEADKTVKAAGYGNTITINPKKPNLLYLGGVAVLEVEIHD